MKRKLGLAVASIALGAATAVTVPATAQAAPSASAIAGHVPATWQRTGEYYRTKTTCMADASKYLSASNVYGYRCIQMDRKLWRGEVYAD
ncbi:hypothetical protein ABZ924_19410 [Streptomyces sp. NPDC046876]|uniref:hypothetical protein n=1 Tax=Streptomyces sp. NPDC046876 TaxID=3155616 RepID=UPI0033ECDF25